MIEQDVYAYFKDDTVLSGYLGGNEKIYLISVDMEDEVKTPWVIVEVTSGTRVKLTQSKMQETAFLRISVDTSPDKVFDGRTIIERCKALLENYRGILGYAEDVYISTGAVRGWAGFGDIYRYQFDATAVFTETYSQP